MKKVLLFLLYVLLSCNGFGQNLKWDGEFKHVGAFPAAECPRDNYGNFCAVIDVIWPVEEFDVESDMIVKADKIVGRRRYFVCVPVKEKTLTIYAPGYYPLEIPFSSAKVSGGEVYQVVIMKEGVSNNSSFSNNSIKTSWNDLYEKGKDYYETGFWKDAFDCFTRAAELGDSRSMNMLGLCYQYGKGVAQSCDKAVEWFRKAIEKNNIDAMYNMGELYYNHCGGFYQTSVAVEWYRRAAEKGNAEAGNKLGYCYEHGFGVDRVDYVKSFQYYKMSAELGNADAQFAVGVCYYRGQGVKVDKALGRFWIQKAAAQGHHNAQSWL